MTLEDFLKECKEKGIKPLSYKEITQGMDGNSIVEYRNPGYAKAGGRLGRLLDLGMPGEKGKSGDLMSKLYGEEVVIRTENDLGEVSYHYGKLKGYDGKGFLLGNYHFDRKQIDIFEYSTESIFGENTIVPNEKILSISKIPVMAEEFA